MEIGQPTQTRRHEYRCPFRIVGVGDDTVRAAYGVDAVQAMQLVSQAVGAELFRHPHLGWLGLKGNGFPAADRSLPMEWDRATEATAAELRDEPNAPGLWPPLEVFASKVRPTRCFLFTKVWLPRMWLRGDLFPSMTDAVVHFGIPSPRRCDLLRAHAMATGASWRFVGDLDPLDLTVFASLRVGGSPLRGRPRTAVPVVYCGIDDPWLRLCEQRLGHRELRSVLIRQDPAERRLLTKLQTAGVDVDKLVGPRCAAILRGGLKLEIEGATNAVLYGKGMMSALLRRLLRPGEADLKAAPRRVRGRSR